MSYIGGSQFSVDNRTDNYLFSCIDRAEMMEQIKKDIMPMGYTGRVQANSSANYARNHQDQLANYYGVNNRDPSSYQYGGFKDDKIDASSRATQSASRFNYAYDRTVNKAYVNVSGQNIPNNHLRIIPNRSCMMNGAYELTKPPYDANIEALSIQLMGDDYSLTYDPSNANKYLSYKSNRTKLTRQDLMSSAQQYAGAKPTTLANPLITSLARTQELVDIARENSARRRSGLRVDLPPTPATPIAV